MSSSKKMFRNLRILLLLVSLLIGSVQTDPSMVLADASGNDVSNLLTDFEFSITQGGQVLEEGSELTSDPFSIALSFGVPVLGDTPEPTSYVQKGDFAQFIIDDFALVGGASVLDLVFNGIKLGTVELSPIDDGRKTQIRVVFDGEDEVFDGSFSEVTAQLNATLEYVGNDQGFEDQNYTVLILGKTFTVKVPAIERIYSGEKTGVKRGDEIDWTLRVEAKQANQHVSLAGYKLVDDLENVGLLVSADPSQYDFYIGSTNDRSSATKVDSNLISKEGEKYSLMLPEGTLSPVFVFFTTKIAEDFVTNGTKTTSNVARLYKDEVEKLVISDAVSYDNRWIEKQAGLIEYKTETVDGIEKTVAYITWFITVNHMGASLPNARIVDVFDNRLEFVESQWFTKSGDVWTPVGSANETKPLDDRYFYPNSPLNQNVQLRIKTKVDPSQNIGHKEITVSNNAILEWDNGPGTGIGSGSIRIGIGTNPIRKTVGSYDVKNHTIPWTITVLESDVSVNLRVLDLLVYGSSFNYNQVASIELVSGSGVGLEEMNKLSLDAISNSLVASFRQTYQPGSFSSNQGLTHSVYVLKNSEGQAIADLIVVSQEGATIEVNSSTSKSFGFNSIVTDPQWYLSNSNNTVRNTAMLFSANNKLNERQASRSIAPRAIFKDMLTANASANPEVDKNQRTTDRNLGFNYEDKSVVFRLFVNQNGVNATSGITTIDGRTLGNITVEDVLPAGWEFVDIEDGVKFYLFNASGTPNSMTVGERVTSFSDFLVSDFGTTGRATFTFSTLDQPYVIFVKARPTEDTLDVYFNDNKTTTVTNTMRLTSGEHSTSVNNTQQVTITSSIVDKTLNKLENGIVKWTVSYRPYDIFQNVQVLDQYKLIDTLPEGLEVFTDAQGKLDFTDGNFVVTELELTPSGYVASGPTLSLEQLQSAIIYDPVTRKLIFEILDKEKAYQFEYKTMITANSGSLTNTVVLEGVGLTNVNTSRTYSVASSDASATMTRNGWVEIEKQNQDRVKLSDSQFTVFTADKSVAIRVGTTNTQGIVVIRGLPIGDYILQETKAPSGYVVSDRQYQVSVRNEAGTIVTRIDGQSGSNANKLLVTNYQVGTSGNLTVSKQVSGNDADQTRDFTFTLEIAGVSGTKDYMKTLSDGSVTYGSVELAQGQAVFSLKHLERITIFGLPKDANFNLSEQAADYIPSYQINGGSSVEGNRATGSIVVDSEVVINYANHRDTFAYIVIKKSDALSNNPIDGTRFELYDEEMNFVSDFPRTDSEGRTRLDQLPLATYYVVEVEASSGYILNSSPVMVNPMRNVDTVVQIDNQPYRSIRVIKSDALDASKLLPNVPFVLRNSEGQIVDAKVTGVNGQIVFEGLAFGVYTLEELLPLPNYQPLASSIEVTLDESSQLITFVNISNFPQGEISLIKSDENSKQPLAGVEFSLYNEANVLIETRVTDENGFVRFGQFNFGKYYVIETKPLPGYVQNDTRYDVDFTEETSNVFTFAVENYQYRSIEVTKLDSYSSRPIEGVEFTLYNDREEVIAVAQTNALGMVEFNGLVYGSYVVRETNVADGYMMNEAEYEFDFTSETEMVQRITVENVRYRSIEVIKVDAYTGSPLDGVIFDLYQGEELVDSKVTDEQGKVVFDGLDFGEYELVERAPLEGYMPLEENIMITFERDGNPEAVVVVENDQYRTIEVTKKDAETGRVLEGVEFELYLNDELIDSGITDVNGIVRFTDLMFGSYTLVESKPLVGYLPLEKPVEVIVDKTELVARLTVTNEIDPDVVIGDDDDNLPPTSDNPFPYGGWLMILGLLLVLISLIKDPVTIKKN